MFPIRDHNSSGRIPYVVYALIVANVLIYCTYGFANEHVVNAVYRDWALFPIRITHGQDFGTLISAMFLHGGVMHLAGNMLFLWIFGDNLEDELGHVGFLLFYLATGLIAWFVQIVSAPMSQIPTLGASGAVAGVMGGYLLLFPRAKVDILLFLVFFFRIFAIPAFIMLGLWFALQFIGSIASDGDTGGVAYWAHTGGFLGGVVLILPAWLKRGGPSYWGETHGHPPHPETQYNSSRIPKVRRK